MASTLSTEDRLDIQDLYARYAWALDTGDVEGVVQTFVPDGVVVTTNGDRHEGRDGIRAWGKARLAVPKAFGSQHVACQLLMQGDGEICKVKSYRATLTYNQVEETKRAVDVVGYYLDTCVKRDGVWYFSERVFKIWAGKDFPWKSPLPPLTDAAKA